MRGVASGAIASDYQRTRVERVCTRLGLVSLAYLWHQPQGALLRRMVGGGIEAILVKIAAAGLVPGRHLGARLAALPAQLHALRRRYGINVCGEGGEYETLTLDCPLFPLGRIVLDAWDTVTVSNDALAPVALLHPTAFHVEPKARAGSPGAADSDAAVAAQQFSLAKVLEVPRGFEAPEAATQPAPPDPSRLPQAQLLVAEAGQYVTLTAEVPSTAGGGGAQADTAAALTAALSAVDAALPALGLAWPASLFAHLYVPDMSQFGAANAAYGSFFPAVNPPARATVELAAGGGLTLAVEVLFCRAPALRRVLHVQSISEWAPSCIGPYAQAAAHAGLVLFAGQIGLHPPTMEVVPGGLDMQAVRCLASCQAVAIGMRTHLAQALLWATVYVSDAAGSDAWAQAAAHIDAFLEGCLETGLWLRGAGCGGACGGEQAAAALEGWDGQEGGDEEDEELDDYLRPPDMRRHWRPLLTFVTVPQLPRG